MNKRANIPIVILVLGIFAVCTLALLSFYSSSIEVENSFNGISEVRELTLEIETKSLRGESLEGLFREGDNSKVYNPFSEDKIIFSVMYNP